jgi:hypothetical protein
MPLGKNLRPDPRAFSRWLLLHTRHRGHSFSPSPRHPAPSPPAHANRPRRCRAGRFHSTGMSSHCRISLRIPFGDSSSGGGHPFNACIRLYSPARQPGKAPVGIRSWHGRGRRSRSLNNSLPQPLLLPLSMGGSEASRAEPSCWWVVRKAERPNSRIAPSAPCDRARRWFRPPNRRVQATRPPWLPAARSTGGRSRAKRRNTRQCTLGSGPHGRRCRHPENSGPCPTHAPWLASHSGSRPLTS